MSGRLVEAQDGADGQQPMCSSAPKAGDAPRPPRYCNFPSISNCSTSSEESEDSYYIPNNYYSDESGYDLDMFKKNWKDDF
jgi:hypothetical protein